MSKEIGSTRKVLKSSSDTPAKEKKEKAENKTGENFNRKIFSERLRLLREEENMTQDNIANALGTSQANANRIERRKVAPSADQLVTLSKLFDVSIDWLVGNTSRRSHKGKTTTRYFCEILAERALEKGATLRIELFNRRKTTDWPVIFFDDGVVPEAFKGLDTETDEINRFLRTLWRNNESHKAGELNRDQLDLIVKGALSEISDI